MNILITGGNGFLGSNTIRRFLSENHRVYVISRNTYNIHDILDKVEYGFGKTSDTPKLIDAISKFQPDAVLHMGWSGGNSHLDVNDTKQIEENIEPGVNLLKLLSTLPKKPHFFGFGSFSEYGTYNIPISEDFLENPINLYGLSKYTYKNYSKMLCKMYDMDWTWIRPCYIYGPYDVSTRVVPMLINKFLKNEDVKLDECDKKLDYLYVDDFVTYVYNLVVNRFLGVYNICSGTEYKLRDVITLILKLTETRSNVSFDPKLNRKFVSNYICGDNAKVKSVTNILPQIDLESGLINTINYYRK